MPYGESLRSYLSKRLNCDGMYSDICISNMYIYIYSYDGDSTFGPSKSYHTPRFSSLLFLIDFISLLRNENHKKVCKYNQSSSAFL